MDKRVFLLTGATSGIGKALAFDLAQTGETVLLTARDQDRRNLVYEEIMSHAQNPNVEFLTCDLSSFGSIRNFAAFVRERYQKIDVLINNASIYKRERTVSADGHELMFATNHLGPFLLTGLLLDLLREARSARILNVTAPSRTKPNFDDLDSRNGFNSRHVFGATRMMNLLFTFELARRLEGTNVTCNAIHPGLARSNLLNESNPIIRWFTWMISASPQRAADPIARAALLPQFAQVNGKFLFKGREIKAPDYAFNREAQVKLWETSLEMTGLDKETFHE